MGGSSSKKRNSSKNFTVAPTISIESASGSTTNEPTVCLKKAKKKDKKNRKKRGGACQAITDSMVVECNTSSVCSNLHKSISFQDKPPCDGEHSSTPKVYRKKSACPSCDTRDMILTQLRTRSGSEKCLRYSDFNKVVRQSRVDNIDIMDSTDVPLDGVPDPDPETVCFICGVFTGSVTRMCRICLHVYHNGCLQKIGHSMDEHAVQLAQAAKWACHQCSDISRLVTTEEAQQASACLTELGIDPDAIAEKDYILHKEKMCAALGQTFTPEMRSSWVERFRFICGDQDSALMDWGQFLQAETPSILGLRCKSSLVHLMTDSEFALARKKFKEIAKGDNAPGSGVTNCIGSLYEEFGNCRQPVEESSEQLQNSATGNIIWVEFLRHVAIHLITIRENPKPATKSVTTPVAVHSEPSGAMTPSIGSVDDEDYKTCDSDLDALASPKDDASKIDLSDDQTLDDDSDCDRSMSLLDQMSKTFHLDDGNSLLTKSEDESNRDKAEEINPVAGNNNTNSVQSGMLQDQNQNVPRMTQDSIDFTTNYEKEVTQPEDADNQNIRPRQWQSQQHNPGKHPNLVAFDSREPEIRPGIAERIVTKRRSEILVRPSTEEGKSPRRPLSQKIIAPAYGLVGKLQGSDWSC